MKLKMFDERVNLELFYQMKNMILSITTKEVSDIFNNSILGYEKVDTAITDIYEFKYPGEVLERHKEKNLESIKDLRALALSLAECKDMLEPTMFVADQYSNFINEIKECADKDVFLLSALFILSDDQEEQTKLRTSILNVEITDISELLILMSMLPNNGYCWQMCGKNIASIFGLHMVDVYENFGVLEWIHRMYADEIKADRSISMRVMKSLMALFDSNVKEKSKSFVILSTHGYTESEIHYLNMELSKCYNMTKVTPKIRTLQVIMINGLKFFLSSDVIENYNIVKLCELCLSKQRRLVRNYLGIGQLIYLFPDIEINNVNLFITLYRNCEDCCHPNWFKFNILDSKWEILYTELGPEVFKKMFVKSLKYYRFKNLKDHVDRYNTLTQSDFVKEYMSTSSTVDPEFMDTLVNAGLINVKSLINECHDSKGDDSKCYHLAKYLYHCDLVKNAEYWEYIIDTYGIEELSRLCKVKHVLSEIMQVDYKYVNYNAWSRMKDIQTEYRLKVFYWVCEEVYYDSIHNLANAIYSFMTTDYSTILPKNELHTIVDCMLLLDSVNDNCKRFLAMNKATDEVRQQYQNDLEKKRKEDEEACKQKEIEEYTTQIKDSLADIEDDNKKLDIITELFGDYRSYKKSYFMLCLERLDSLIDNIEVTNEQAGKLVTKLTKGLERKLINFNEFKSYLERIKVA